TTMEKTGLKGIRRRDFLKGATALAIGSGSIQAAFGQEPAPKRGGRFRAGLTGASNSDTFNPGLYNSVSTNIYGPTLGNCLLQIDNKNKLVAELAESWEPSKDLKTWRFKLRKGVEFHNGKSLTPADVIYSLNFHRGEGNKSAMNSVFKPVTD